MSAFGRRYSKPRILLYSAVLLIGVRGLQAATLTNYLNDSPYWLYHSLVVNVGDTIVWVNQQDVHLGTNYIESFGGEFKSPLMNTGDSFSFRFTNAGFYAYRTGLQKSHPTPGAEATVGTITVNAWTGSPPAVTLNAPLNGSVLSLDMWLVQASATNADNLAQIDYFANSSLIGTATNPPFIIQWGVPYQSEPYLTYTITAKATDPQGAATWSEPVNITVAKNEVLWGPQVLPTGELLFHYNGSIFTDFIVASDSLMFTNNAQLAGFEHSGVFIDEAVRGGGFAERFYKIVYGPP